MGGREVRAQFDRTRHFQGGDTAGRRHSRSGFAFADSRSTPCCASCGVREKPIGQWFPVRLHHAAVEIGARVVLLDDKAIQPGATANVQLVLDQPIAAAVPDRYVIRDVSAQRTLGGGQFIDLRAPARRRRTPERRLQRAALAVGDPLAAFGSLLAVPPFASDIMIFARDRALSAAQTQRIVAGTGICCS